MRTRAGLLALVLVLVLAGCASSPEKYRQRGAELLAAGQFAEAAINYRKALQAEPSHAPAWVALARAELKQGHSVEAFQSLNRARQLAPGEVAIREELAELCYNAYVSDARRPAALYQMIQTELTGLVEKKSAAGFRLQGQMLLAEKKPEEAMAALLQAEQLKPGETTVALALGQALALLKRFDEAERRLKPLADRDVTEAYRLLYLVYTAAGQRTEAQALLTRKTERRPRDPQAWLELAHHFRTTGQAPASEAIFEQLVARRAELPGVRQQLGDYWLQQNEATRAVEQYEAGENEAKTAEARTLLRKRRILARISQKETALAMAALEDLTRTNPADHDAAHMLAVLWLEAGQTERSQSELRRLAAAHATNAAYQFSYGRALLAAGQLNEAEQQFTKTLELDGRHQASRAELLEVRLRQGKYELALATADLLRKDDPARYRHQRVQALIGLGRSNEAQQELALLDAQAPETMLGWGLLRYAEKRYAEAEALFAKLYTSRGDIASLQRMALTRLARQQGASALALVEEALRRQPTPALRAFLAALYLETGQAAAAEREYRALQSAEPRNGEFVLRTGMARLAQHNVQGKLAAAIASFEEARVLRPQDPAVLSLLGTAYVLSGRGAEAVPLYRQSLRTYPEDPELWNALAFALADSAAATERQEALALAQKALAKRPQHLDYQDTIGYVHYKLGQLDDALPIFQALCRRAAPRAGYALHLGMVQAALGQRSEARQALEAALRAGPSGVEEQQIREWLRRLG